jgi:hypothetical protein
MDISFSKFDPEEFMRTRFDRFRQVRTSQEFYDGLDYANRETIIRLVKRSLMLAHDTVDDWLSDSFSFDETGSVITVELNLLAADIESDVADRVKLTDARIKELYREAMEGMDDLL